eukprot:CAMPEP_0169288142 /NCGR_PEP_ID=MMETSP1016-20121227/60376_1 /TAXON_ID=342587 /ORGANISM="Karlodinium micrum, Strain CCMP2283" /LENGTH=87 /DNA_ID=CAMNT_0009378301 /DNA_START=56 /DNA_END=316 /DNA_ORIENTATION=-
MLVNNIMMHATMIFSRVPSVTPKEVSPIGNLNNSLAGSGSSSEARKQDFDFGVIVVPGCTGSLVAPLASAKRGLFSSPLLSAIGSGA